MHQVIRKPQSTCRSAAKQEANLFVKDFNAANKDENEATIIGSLKICAERTDLHHGRRLHAEILRRGLLEEDINIGNALVSLYVKCSWFEKAKEVFSELPFKNTISWNTLISGCAKYGNCEEALNCFHRMQSEGVIPSAITFVCILKACGSLGAAKKGNEVHAMIVRCGLLEENVAVGNALIHMYAKCGNLEKAQQVFAELPIWDAVTWNVLIAAFIEHGHIEKAWSYFEFMQSKAIPPNTVTFICLLKACGSMQAFTKGREIHEDILRKGLLEKDVVVGNSVVDMYVKCGALCEAREVFEGLRFRDVVTWTVMIAAYSQHGHIEKAMNCFEQMRVENIIPNTITYVSVLKACSSMESVDKGTVIHIELVCRGFMELLEKDIVFGNALVDMYCKCDAFAKALEVFDKLQVRDVISWTSLITGYTQHGLDEVALACFEHMQCEGLYPNSFTIGSVLKACGSIGALDKGKKIHSNAIRGGLLEKGILVGNALVGMYATSGALAEAQEVFDGLEDRDVVSWNSIITGYVQHDYWDEALNHFECMQKEGVCPNAVTFACILNACGRIGATNMNKLHDGIMNERFVLKDISVGSASMNIYGRCGALREARDIFNKLQAQDMFLWSALIAAYVQRGHFREALTCFDRMKCEGLSPNSTALICILKACGSIGAANLGKDIYDEVNQNGILEKEICVTNALLDMYGKCNALTKAQSLLNKLRFRDTNTWNTLITAYVQQGHGEEALCCFEQMQQEGFPANSITFAYILKACGETGAADKGKELHTLIVKERLLVKDTLIGNSLVDMYAKLGAFVKGEEVLDELRVRDTVSWTALMTGYVHQGYGWEALQCFHRMEQEGLFPDAVVVICLLKACGSIGAVGRGAEVHAKFVRKGFLESEISVGNALVDMYFKCGSLESAQKAFSELQLCNEASWNTLISGYAQNGFGEEALYNFEWMQQNGFLPSTMTFVVLLSACSHSGLVEKGTMLFEAMRVWYGIIPTSEHYTCMVDLFGRAGNLSKSLLIIRTMLNSNCSCVWSALLRACQKFGDVRLGRLAYEHVLQLDERNATAHITLGNSYAVASIQGFQCENDSH